jgi:hypothetical protein
MAPTKSIANSTASSIIVDIFFLLYQQRKLHLTCPY